jgi:hypothetical protein
MTDDPVRRYTSIGFAVMIFGALAMWLAACSPGATTTAVAQTEVALTAAEKAATLYVSLPQCPKGTPLCSESAIIVQIKAADTVAFNATMAARSGGDDAKVAAANAAIATLVTLIPTPTTH